MPDREKVIRAWECCNPFNRKCNECPYEKDCYHDGISRHMVADAIELLKEQEAKLKFLDALYNYINPNDMEQYMQMYRSLPVPSDGR